MNRNRSWKKKVHLKSDSSIGKKWEVRQTGSWVVLPLFWKQVTLHLAAGVYCLCWFVLDLFLYLSYFLLSFVLLFFLPFLSHGWWPICLIIIFKQSSKKQKNIVWWIFNIKSLLTMNCYWVRYNLSKWQARFSCDITQIRFAGAEKAETAGAGTTENT